MKQQNLSCVLLVGLLWICPVYLSRRNDKFPIENPMEIREKCFKDQKRCLLVPGNFNGFITASKHLNHSGDACIVFLQKNKTRNNFGEWWPRVEKNGSSYLLYMAKQHVKKDQRMYVLYGKNCSSTISTMTECVFSHTVTGTCQIRCVQTNTVCKQSPYKENDCKGHVASSAKYRINLTETSSSCLNCDNPVKKPDKTINLDKAITVVGGKLDAVQTVELINGVGNIVTNMTELSAVISVGEHIKGIIEKKREPEDVDEVSFASVSPHDPINIIEDKEILPTFSRSVTVPKEAFEQAISLNVTTAHVTVFRLFNFSLDEFNSTVLGDEVVSVEVGVAIANLTDTVKIYLRNIEYKGIPSCQSWNGEGSRPKWTSNDCDTIISGDNVTCQCTHLTFFAVLLAPLNETISSSDLKQLTIITQVGCGLSTLFLSVALFMHFLFRRTMASKATIILIQLMSAMLLLNLTFMTNNYVAQLKNSVGCKIMGALMHYFMLATFTWFAAQAFHLCLQLYTGGNILIHNYLLKVSIITWVVPSIAVIVLFSTGKYSQQVIHTDNTGDIVTMCWITDSDVHYIVNIGYYALVFLFTFSTFLIIVTWLFQLKRVKGPNVPLSQNGRSIVTILGLCCILGITWGFAFFAHGVLQIPAFYIFTVLNSSQ
uniref:Uncharacterized protein n=2 Tax=Amphiprion ocellaris TaxID=80972 RepID=A0A3Q1CZI0_AMPOC